MFQDATGETVRRDYTPRSFDREKCELDIEFALHGKGKASDWARQAKIGQRAVIGGPKGSMIVPLDYDWYLLVGDDSALPAIRRRLEELPAGARVSVIAQTGSAGDQWAFRCAAQPEMHWVRSGAEILTTVRGLSLSAGEGFVWCAGESGVMQQIREILLNDKRHPKEAMRVAAYWKPGAEDFHEQLAE